MTLHSLQDRQNALNEAAQDGIFILRILMEQTLFPIAYLMSPFIGRIKISSMTDRGDMR